MTAAPTRHGHTASVSSRPAPAELPPTVTPLHLPQTTRGRDTPDTGPTAPPRRRWGGALATGAVMATIWAVLLGDQPGSWLLGAPAILSGAALAATVPDSPAQGPRRRVSPGGALRFAGWFARHSVLGAADVAWRACHPRLPIAPGFRSYATALPEGPPRTLFANCITLLPGTLTADIDGARLTIHMLDRRQDLDRDLGALEARVGAIWGLPGAGDTPPEDRT